MESKWVMIKKNVRKDLSINDIISQQNKNKKRKHPTYTH